MPTKVIGCEAVAKYWPMRITMTSKHYMIAPSSIRCRLLLLLAVKMEARASLFIHLYKTFNCDECDSADLAIIIIWFLRSC